MRELVVELEHQRFGSAAVRRAYFDEQCRALAPHITALGGEIVNQTWINSSVLVRVPEDAVEALERVEGVQRVDAPHKITRE